MNGSKVTTIFIMYEKMFTTPCVSWVTCQMSSVRCQLSHVTKQIQIGAVSWSCFCSNKAKFSHKSFYVTNLAIQDFGLPIFFELKSFLKIYIYILFFKVPTKKGFSKILVSPNLFSIFLSQLIFVTQFSWLLFFVIIFFYIVIFLVEFFLSVCLCHCKILLLMVDNFWAKVLAHIFVSDTTIFKKLLFDLNFKTFWFLKN